MNYINVYAIIRIANIHETNPRVNKQTNIKSYKQKFAVQPKHKKNSSSSEKVRSQQQTIFIKKCTREN